MLCKGVKREVVPYAAHVLQIAQRRSNLIKGVLLHLRFFLDLLAILICRCSHSVRAARAKLGICCANSNTNVSEDAQGEMQEAEHQY